MDGQKVSWVTGNPDVTQRQECGLFFLGVTPGFIRFGHMVVGRDPP